MTRRITILVLAALTLASCGGGGAEDAANATPERTVVGWFEAIDTGESEAATSAVSDVSLAVMLGVENGLDASTISSYVEDGVPASLAADYWASFGVGFAEFAARPISTLTVGESEVFETEGSVFAAVPISAGAGADSVVLVREAENGWEIDLIATLADGFSTVLADRYAGLGADEPSQALRAIYDEVVVPALWAAMAEGEFGDEFNRVALTLLSEIEG